MKKSTLKGIFMAAITMAMVLAISMHTRMVFKASENSASTPTTKRALNKQKILLPSKRVSRFLAADGGVPPDFRNPRAASHCRKDNEICPIEYGNNTSCCNNKCLDLRYDNKNCGICKAKCKYTETCCRGECVDLAYDKRHCGVCNHRCELGQYCIYGMCDYP
ncbi:hypothetical protein Ancab_004418 [Ancistrocladus abbreviatus]